MWIVLSENLSRRKKKKWLFDFVDYNNIYVIVFTSFILLASILWVLFWFYQNYFLQNFNKFIKTIIDYNKNNIIIVWTEDWKYKWLNYQEKFLRDVEKKIKITSWEKQKDLVWKINSALPDVLEKEFVIKFFEDLFLTISTKNSPVILNSVNVWSASYNELELWKWEKIKYKKYPISLWFSASDKEYNRILDIIQVSWLFNKKYYFKGSVLPVMTVSAVQMNFSDKNKWKEVVDDTPKWRSLQLFMYSYWDKENKIKK